MQSTFSSLRKALLARCDFMNIRGRAGRFLDKESTMERLGGAFPGRNQAAPPFGVGLVSTACIG